MTTPTKTEKADHLKSLGWTRVSSTGRQSWRDPEETASWTLAAAWQFVNGRRVASTGDPMTFPDWLADHIDERSPVGDLARDAAEDPDFPTLESLGAYRDYLWTCGATHDAVLALERAWQRYTTARRKAAAAPSANPRRTRRRTR